MRRIELRERRARLAVRHHLATAEAATTPLEAARGVVALHATDPASVHLSVRARTSSVPVEAIERALYEERSLVRMIGMRRTLFVVPREAVATMHAACSAPIAVVQRRRYLKLMADAGLGDGAWLTDVEAGALAALRDRGSATAAQLSTDEPRLRSKVLLAPGKAYEATANITSWVLFLMAIDGRIVRGRPLGSWTGSQWRWHLAEEWFPEGIDAVPADKARVEWARRWLAAFGPGTVADLKWWTGWPLGQVRQALAALDVEEVDLDGSPGVVLAADTDGTAEPSPWVSLLPALDPTPMGWQQRQWFLGDHGPRLFDRNGNIGPTVWCDGRIVGGWAQRTDGEIAWSLLEDVGRETAEAVAGEAARLQRWTGTARVVPRFRTPLERQLTS